LIDDGPDVVGVLNIVKNMCDNGTGSCVMGNHEFNYLSYTTPDPDNPDQFLRCHGVKNDGQNIKTREAFINKSNEERMYLAWMMTLPLFIETDDFRLIHACWMPTTIDKIKNLRNIDGNFLYQANKKSTSQYNIIENTIKGPEAPLIEPFTDRNGDKRYSERVRWWVSKYGTEPLIAIHPEFNDNISRNKLRPVDFPGYGNEEKKLFIGHYSFTDTVVPIKNNLACLDYKGYITAYRYDGEDVLTPSNFIQEPKE
jgi:hypothetical protein